MRKETVEFVLKNILRAAVVCAILTTTVQDIRKENITISLGKLCSIAMLEF